MKEATGSSVDLTRSEFRAVRHLLENEETWDIVAQGTVDDLAKRITSRLQPSSGRTAEASHAAALIIARGILEFTAADLDPKVFRQVLMARMRRIESGTGSALDGALISFHGDLAVRFDDIMTQFKRVLDRLPPGPAERGEIAVYLKTLIDWLNTDPWPRDRQFRGPVLTPATIERRLSVRIKSQSAEKDFNADDLASNCIRLVVLGGPGSGKTWLAKRTVRRCAEAALQSLAVGGLIDDIELPLYTTCAHLFNASGDVREAAVSSALDYLGDLGGSRLTMALRSFFTERSTSTLLVIDSLDEAQGSSDRLGQVDSLPWRVVLTSRPSSWNFQLNIDEDDTLRRIGELQSLRYPDDVEPFIRGWFARQPERAEDLIARVSVRPAIQQAVTVPLILAFFCIVGGEMPLPEYRRDLYKMVIMRILTGRWRGSNEHRLNPQIYLETLQEWAWAGASSDSRSGIGTWDDDIWTNGWIAPDEISQHILDHVAMPLGPPDVDTGKTLRHFIHWSIREHLVAQHVASLSLEEAVEILLPHLWYDSYWEYSAPAAIVMHPQRDRLVREMMCYSAKSDQIPKDISLIDGGGEWRTLLASLASESSEADWS